jgi:hypothetical protein
MPSCNGTDKAGDSIRQSAIWRALESKSIFELGQSCRWSPEFVGAVLNAPPGVLVMDDIVRECFIKKVAEFLPDSYHMAIEEAEQIKQNINAVIILVTALSGINRPYDNSRMPNPAEPEPNKFLHAIM